MKRIPRVAALLSLVIAPGVALAADPPAPAPADDTPDVVKGITGRELGGHMKFLASDLMRGRDTASAEIFLAGEYIASRLFAAGAEPMGDPAPGGKKTYFQKFPLEVATPSADGMTVVLTLEQNGARRVVPLKAGTDFLFNPRGLKSDDVDSPIVFAGHGHLDSDPKLDDLAGLDVKGRFVLVFAGSPTRPGAPNAGRPRGGRRMNMGPSPALLEEVKKRGGIGVIVIPEAAEANPAAQQQAEAQRAMFMQYAFRPSMTLGSTPAAMPALALTASAREQVLAATGLTPETKPGLLDGSRIHFAYTAKKEMKSDRNVIGFFPGTDKEKAKEIVVFSAHYDHVGVDEKGVIFNGSDDNASGTSSLLEIAEAFGDGPRPARSVLFLWVSGEEKGLFGSEWFSDHMTIPAGSKIVADINLDMVSRNDGKRVGITPSGKHPDHSTMIPAAVAALKAEGMTPTYDADEFYYRSDHYNFAKKGIPIIFFFAGVHDDYHQPTDDVEKADFEKAARVARSAYRLGWHVAQAADVPKKIKAEVEKKPEVKAEAKP